VCTPAQPRPRGDAVVCVGVSRASNVHPSLPASREPSTHTSVSLSGLLSWSRKLRIVTCGISGGEVAHRAVLRDTRRFPSTRWYPVPGATRTTLGFGICPSFKGHFLSRRAKPSSYDSPLFHRCTAPVPREREREVPRWGNGEQRSAGGATYDLPSATRILTSSWRMPLAPMLDGY
jgi:hypothetical protein